MMILMHESPGARPGSRYTSIRHAVARHVAQRGLLKPLVWSLVDVTVRGTENLDGVRAPFVVVGNHSSHLDAPLVLGALPPHLSRYLAAGAAADYFFDVWWRKGLTALFFNAFPVERYGLRKRSKVATTLLAEGVPLLLFPEGTRSHDGSMAPFKRGTAALCLTAGVPCLPMAIVGASKAMPRGTSWPVRGRPRVTVVFGAPMTPHEGEHSSAFSARIEERVRELHLSVAPLPPSTRRRHTDEASDNHRVESSRGLGPAEGTEPHEDSTQESQRPSAGGES
jgi:1-acyl-sn-glycerol-3-phosphate acyltransferase